MYVHPKKNIAISLYSIITKACLTKSIVVCPFQRRGENINFVPAVCIDSLHLAEYNPEPERDRVAWSDCWPDKGGDTKYQNLSPVCVWSCEADGRRELMVDAVDFLVPPLPVEEPVDPVIEVVLNKEVYQQLRRHLSQGRQWKLRVNSHHLH